MSLCNLALGTLVAHISRCTGDCCRLRDKPQGIASSKLAFHILWYTTDNFEWHMASDKTWCMWVYCNSSCMLKNLYSGCNVSGTVVARIQVHTSPRREWRCSPRCTLVCNSLQVLLFVHKASSLSVLVASSVVVVASSAVPPSVLAASVVGLEWPMVALRRREWVL